MQLSRQKGKDGKRESFEAVFNRIDADGEKNLPPPSIERVFHCKRLMVDIGHLGFLPISAVSAVFALSMFCCPTNFALQSKIRQISDWLNCTMLIDLHISMFA
jgi:hypothetical protein